jgi:hypothetical protein
VEQNFITGNGNFFTLFQTRHSACIIIISYHRFPLRWYFSSWTKQSGFKLQIAASSSLQFP